MKTAGVRLGQSAAERGEFWPSFFGSSSTASWSSSPSCATLWPGSLNVLLWIVTLPLAFETLTGFIQIRRQM